jgi:hypothetical protein
VLVDAFVYRPKQPYDKTRGMFAETYSLLIAFRNHFLQFAVVDLPTNLYKLVNSSICVVSPSISRRPGTKIEYVANFAIATCFAIIAGVDVFLFSTNPVVFVSVGLGVGIVSFKMNYNRKILILGALVGVAGGYLFVVLSGIFRYMLVWIGVSISAFIAMFLGLLPRIRQRFTWKTLFSVSLASVCFIATLVIFATFLSPIFFLQISGVQAFLRNSEVTDQQDVAAQLHCTDKRFGRGLELPSTSELDSAPLGVGHSHS